MNGWPSVLLMSDLRGGMLAALVLTLASTGTVKAACLPFEPQTVELTGVAESRMFPGPPNYESIAHDDQPEYAIILELRKKTCFSGKHRDGALTEPLWVDKIHIVNLKGKKPIAPKDLSKILRVRGRAFVAATGHHRTPVLLDLESYRVESGSP